MSGYTTAPPPGAGGPRPELRASRRRLAGWWRRVGATLIDGLVITAVAGALLVGALSLLGDSVEFALVTVVVWVPCVVLAALLYAPSLMARTDGQTLGRMAAGTRVVRVDGRRMTFGGAFLRESVIKWGLFYGLGGVLTLGILPLVDVLWPLWDEQKRALHDFPAGTRTIRA